MQCASSIKRWKLSRNIRKETPRRFFKEMTVYNKKRRRHKTWYFFFPCSSNLIIVKKCFWCRTSVCFWSKICVTNYRFSPMAKLYPLKSPSSSNQYLILLLVTYCSRLQLKYSFMKIPKLLIYICVYRSYIINYCIKYLNQWK